MIHGGDIYRNRVRLDYSVNVNPLGIPDKTKRALQDAIERCVQYPDIHSQELTHAISGMCRVKEDYILCGSGASELFLALMHAVKPAVTAIPVPSFGGYEYAANAAESRILRLPMKQEEGFCFRRENLNGKLCGVELLFLANPNNPVGNVLERYELEELLEECLNKNIVVVIDECFLEFTGREETCSMKGVLERYPNLVIVRAFTKMFAIPGVRLGYLFCADSELRSKIAGKLPEWNLSILAQEAGKAACQEKGYREETVELVERERIYLTDNLRKLGITVFPSETNFLLLHTQYPLYPVLLEQGILIRDCSSFAGLEQGYYRIAVRQRQQNEVLIQVLQQILLSAERRN